MNLSQSEWEDRIERAREFGVALFSDPGDDELSSAGSFGPCWWAFFVLLVVGCIAVIVYAGVAW